jgi:hypothetical protein
LASIPVVDNRSWAILSALPLSTAATPPVGPTDDAATSSGSVIMTLSDSAVSGPPEDPSSGPPRLPARS